MTDKPKKLPDTARALVTTAAAYSDHLGTGWRFERPPVDCHRTRDDGLSRGSLSRAWYDTP
jgi:hypothetical protein